MTAIHSQNSTRTPMRALLLANWRIYRVPVLALIVLGVGVYALGLIVYLRSDARVGPRNLSHMLPDTALLALAASTLIAAVLGGMSLAGERADRTALFVAMLPVSRMQIAISKLAVSAFLMTSVLIVHLIVGGSALLMQFAVLRNASVPWQKPIQLDDIVGSRYEPVLVFIAVAFCMFSIAWFLGSFLKSPVISACAGIALTLASAMLFGELLDEHKEWTKHLLVGVDTYLLLIPIFILIGLPSLIVGTIIYARRVEP